MFLLCFRWCYGGWHPCAISTLPPPVCAACFLLSQTIYFPLVHIEYIFFCDSSRPFGIKFFSPLCCDRHTIICTNHTNFIFLVPEFRSLLSFCCTYQRPLWDIFIRFSHSTSPPTHQAHFKKQTLLFSHAFLFVTGVLYCKKKGGLRL